MVCLKPSKSEDVNGGYAFQIINYQNVQHLTYFNRPKYGYLSQIDPDFEHLRKATEESFDALWAMDVSHRVAMVERHNVCLGLIVICG